MEDVGDLKITRITPLKNGPIKIEGEIEIVGGEGTSRRETQVFLCRCGASKTKPLCDGTHRAIGFVAD